MSDDKKIELIDRLGIGLVAAISFLFFYGLLYGLVVLSMRSPTEDVGTVLSFLLSIFIWGPITSFIIGFVFLVNPIEIILNVFDK